jgi:hypothetical protein
VISVFFNEIGARATGSVSMIEGAMSSSAKCCIVKEKSSTRKVLVALQNASTSAKSNLQ